ncbi:hypothetical protein [Leptolyngbya sp. CCY15150]|uniref:hypothetical protein n=1 Tax=Leptolyngbya sp. CCY15150 TaxID=2767772 RepID=UPI00194E82DA|nr:hypothetical protein [Leptolyngbya sp. CCY15150]
METASYQSQLRSLGQYLQDSLQQEVPVPIDVRCVIKQDKLLVLAQHPPDISLDAKRAFSTLRKALTAQTDDLLHPFLADVSTLAVQLYLRVEEQPQPYAFHPFQIEAIAPVEALTDDETDDLLSEDELSNWSSESAMEDEEPLDEPSSPPQRPAKRLSWRLGAAVAGVVVVAGVAAYVLSRPCVLGSCRPLLQAEELFTQSQGQMASATSAADVKAIYEQLTEASYLTTVVPHWSGYYEDALAQRDRYDDHVKAVSRVVDAQADAFAAAQRSQNPPHPIATWEEIRDLWESAIAQLEEVPADSPMHGLAQQKLEEYRGNLAAINQRIQMEQEAQSRVRSAREMAQRATEQEAGSDSPEQWQSAYTAWQISMEMLQPVPAHTMSYAEAQQLLSLYSTRMATLRDRLSQEELSTTVYRQSLQLADQAATYEQQEQWSQAVAAWQNALTNAQQVPTDSAYHDQVQPLVNSYALALEDARQNLRLAIAAQTAEAELNKLCGGDTARCTYQVSREEVQLRLTPAYQATAASFPQPTASSIPLSVSMDTILHQVAQVGNAARVEINVYNADGTLFGRYVPSLSGYVPPAYIEVLDQEPAPPPNQDD